MGKMNRLGYSVKASYFVSRYSGYSTGTLDFSFATLLSPILLKSWLDPLQSISGLDHLALANEERTLSKDLALANHIRLAIVTNRHSRNIQ
jgi:hypothetical protein